MDGDPNLLTEIKSKPLKPTMPSSVCYLCVLRGTEGSAVVSFGVRNEGSFFSCELKRP